MTQKISEWVKQTTIIRRFLGKGPETLTENEIPETFYTWECLLKLNKYCNQFKAATDNFKVLDKDETPQPLYSSLLTSILHTASSYLLDCNKEQAYVNYLKFCREALRIMLESPDRVFNFYSTQKRTRIFNYTGFRLSKETHGYAPATVITNYSYKGVSFSTGLECSFITAQKDLMYIRIHAMYVNLFGEILVIPDFDKTIHVPIDRIAPYCKKGRNKSAKSIVGFEKERSTSTIKFQVSSAILKDGNLLHIGDTVQFEVEEGEPKLPGEVHEIWMSKHSTIFVTIMSDELYKVRLSKVTFYHNPNE